MTDRTSLSPQERLASSRQAIVRQMGHDNAGPAVSHGGSDDEIDASASTWSLVKQAGAAWWNGHPARLALDIAKPAIQNFAEDQPLKLLGVSAGLGAAAVILRPWRLLSLTGLVLAALKSSDMAHLATSLLTSSAGRHPFR